MKAVANFIREQSAVGMIVGIALGLQAATTVNTIVQGFINPIVEYLLSFVLDEQTTLEQLTWTVTESAERGLVISWGLILSGLIRLLAVAFVIYFVVKRLKLDKKA